MLNVLNHHCVVIIKPFQCKVDFKNIYLWLLFHMLILLSARKWVVLWNSF